MSDEHQPADPATTDAGKGGKTSRARATTGWDKSSDGLKFARTLVCDSPEKSFDLAKRVLKIAQKHKAPVTMTYDSASLRLELDAAGKRFAGDGAKVAKAVVRSQREPAADSDE